MAMDLVIVQLDLKEIIVILAVLIALDLLANYVVVIMVLVLMESLEMVLALVKVDIQVYLVILLHIVVEKIQ
jgi:hypothetical protein